MTDAFSEARRVFEFLPGPATLQSAINKLAAAGIERDRIRSFAIDISAEFGTLAYTRQSLDRMLAAATKQEGEP